jgi:hypothetical protein
LDRSADGWSRLLSSGPLIRLLVFMGLLAAAAFAVSRYIADAPVRSNAAASQATERAELQEYFQTHGVRPANRAEMELLEAERRRRDNERRNEKQNVTQEVRDEKKFEEESRRSAEAAAARLRADEERHQENLKREQIQQLELERQASDRKEMERRAEEDRVRRQQEQWQQVIKR